MKRALSFVVLFALTALLSVAHAADVKLVWTAPTACADGTALTNCPTTGYEVSQDGVVKATPAPGVLSQTITLGPGHYCFTLKTLASAGKSDPTNPVCADIPAPLPGKPGNVTLTCTIPVNGQNQPLNCTATANP